MPVRNKITDLIFDFSWNYPQNFISVRIEPAAITLRQPSARLQTTGTKVERKIRTGSRS